MRIGDRVRCVKPSADLVMGQIYIVYYDREPGYVKVHELNGYKHKPLFFASRFELVGSGNDRRLLLLEKRAC